MNISDETVEAALEVFWAKEDETYLEAMRAALAAAAPHLMAQALEEAGEQLEYGNPIGSWLQDRADSYRSNGAGE